MSTPTRFTAFAMTAALALPGAGLMRSCTPPPPVATIESSCVTMVNSERAARGLPALTAHPAVESAAATQSVRQATKLKMTHTGAGGTNAGQRLTAAGYNWGLWAENVAAGQADCTSVVRAWMGSTGHRNNILNPWMSHIGVASAVGSNGTKYWTMVIAG